MRPYQASIIRFGTGLLSIFLFLGCQSKPTRVGESQSREFALIIDKVDKPLKLSDHSVILDARSSFDYGLNRVTGSQHLTWESLAESSQTGELMRDRRRLAQRLALFGLKPDRPIIVLGNGPRGGGEEGRLAWTLVYFGFRDVQISSVELFRKNMTQLPSPAPENVEPTDLEGNFGLVVDKKEFQRWAENPKDRAESRVWILDVRSEGEYFNKTKGAPKVVDIGALNVEWKQFFTDMGRPNVKIREILAALGVQPKDRIIVVSNKGIRSSAAAYALLAIGFHRVENFLAGYRIL
ncbi:MAG: rhodanese-like domain-containing protein [Bdellovibrionales bacterium]